MKSKYKTESYSIKYKHMYFYTCCSIECNHTKCVYLDKNNQKMNVDAIQWNQNLEMIFFCIKYKDPFFSTCCSTKCKYKNWIYFDKNNSK